MNARYRLVWLVPDPYSGGRVPLGALMARDGEVSFVRADTAGLRSLSPEIRALADIVREQLDLAISFDDLPAGAGPQVIAGGVIAVPAAVREPGRWLAEGVLRVA